MSKGKILDMDKYPGMKEFYQRRMMGNWCRWLCYRKFLGSAFGGKKR